MGVCLSDGEHKWSFDLRVCCCGRDRSLNTSNVAMFDAPRKLNFRLVAPGAPSDSSVLLALRWNSAQELNLDHLLYVWKLDN